MHECNGNILKYNLVYLSGGGFLENTQNIQLCNNASNDFTKDYLLKVICDFV